MWVKVDYSTAAKKNPRPNMGGEWAVYTKRHWWNKWVERNTYADIKLCTREAEILVETPDEEPEEEFENDAERFIRNADASLKE